MFAVDSLELAEKRGDRAEYERIVTKTLVHSDSLIAAYRGTARSPRAQAFINKALDEMMGVGHEGHHVMPGTQSAGILTSHTLAGVYRKRAWTYRPTTAI
jgi:hypothetical protein